MTGNVVVSEVDALMYVVQSKAEKTRALWELSWYHRMFDATNDVSQKPVKPCFCRYSNPESPSP